MTSTRADIITRRTYSRPLVHNGTEFESWDDICQRVIAHQCWLWERAITHGKYPEIPLHDLSEDMPEWITLNCEQTEELQELYNLIYDRKVCPSGRTLWLGNTDVAKRRESSMFNCSFVSIETVYDVVDGFWLLLQGCGLGIAPVVGTLTGFRKPIPEIEVINSTRTFPGGRDTNEETFEDGVWTISVGDSAEAWAKSIGKLLAGKYNAKKLVFDFSNIRGAGIRLKGYGWISSGDVSISKAYPAIAEILNKKAGSILNKIDILDIINWLGTVLSSRRSAQIVLVEYGSMEWKEFATAKNRCYEEEFKHRQQSNNSLVFYRKPSRTELEELFDLIVKSGGSEPGFINGEAALKKAPWYSGNNPSLRAGTLVYTDKGIIPIDKLEDKEFGVFTDKKIIQRAKCKLSGVNQRLYKITLKGGHEIYSTKEHQWPIYRKGWNVTRDKWSSQFKVNTENLKPLDCLPMYNRDTLFKNGKKGSYKEGRFLGWLQGDGWITIRGDNGLAQIGMVVSYKETEMIPLLEEVMRPYSKAKFNPRDNNTFEFNTSNKGLYKYIKDELGFINKENIPESIFSNEYSEEFRKGFIDGIISSDGHVEITSDGCKIRIGLTSSRDNFIDQMSALFGFYGIKTGVTKGNTILKGKTFTNKTIRIAGYNSVKHFKKLFKLSVEHKQDRIEKYFVKPKKQFLTDKNQIVSIERTDLFEDVWDIGVYGDTHTFQLAQGITGNCNEILLSNKSFCNLVEIDISKFYQNSSGLHKAVYLAARMNYRQTVVDFRDGILQESWHLNNEFLRLCGVGVTGVIQREDLSEFDWTSLKYTAVSSARGMAKELDLQHPQAVTCVKPSGTISKIMDTTEGIHKPLGKYIFNWVNFSKVDPMVDILKSANYKVIDNPSDFTGSIVCLPIEWKHIEFETITKNEIECEVNLESAVLQLNRYLKVQTNYCDHNVSNTISYDKEEIPEIINWLLTNWDNYIGVSFLFRTDPTKNAKDLGYDYLPQEVVTKEEYYNYIEQLLPVNFDSVHTYDEIEDEGCATGACPIK